METLKRLLGSKIWKILLIFILLTAVVSAKVDIKVSNGEDSVKFVVKNTGSNPIYVLNVLTILNNKGNVVYTSGDTSSADVLKISPRKSYTFEWQTHDAIDGTYKGKLYIGNDKKHLTSTYTDNFKIWHIERVDFYTNKMTYKYGESVNAIFKNMGYRTTAYVDVNNWKITNTNGNVVDSLSLDCGYSYDVCANSFEPVGFLQKVQQTWDQKDNNGNQVSPGIYKVTAEYSYDSSGSVIKTISTSKFYIMAPRRR